ncbi:anti-sigma-K factor RskA [Variovorax sp. GrIS 2.14]|uniref:anti-sigma factor n=1 Tax=Variovorax sp. GrIS 2.14 TaxID=3071709 RepID=UPI0038F815FC
MSTPNTSGEDIDALAGEYVLGTLNVATRQIVAARIEREPALRDAVTAWDARLLPLVALAPPSEPSTALWRRIEGSLGEAAAAVKAPVMPASPRPKVESRRPSGWWNNLGLWRGMTGAGFATAAALAAVLVLRPGTPQAPEYMVVLVAPQDKAPGYVIQTNAAHQLSLVPLGTATVPSQKSLQFWTKGDQWRGPVSLGLVKPGQTLYVPLGKLPAIEPNQLFELTLEPENGSPIDRPTGPIQYIGRAVKVL